MSQPDSPAEGLVSLGDVIRIVGSSDLPKKTRYIVTYIDTERMEIGDIRALDEPPRVLYLDADGAVTNYDVSDIRVVQKAAAAGFAAQNGLDVGAWVDVRFGGENPYILTGQITGVEDDVAELTERATSDKIYIPFQYRGIPKDMDIEAITIRNPPSEGLEEKEEKQEKQENEDRRTKGPEDDAPDDAPDDDNDPRRVRDIVIDANQIVFGDFLDDYVYRVEKDDNEQRFSKNEQKIDLYETLVREYIVRRRATDTAAGEDNVYITHESDIERIVERFYELHQMFSVLNQSALYERRQSRTEQYRALAEAFERGDLAAAPWAIPVVSAKRRIYDLGEIYDGEAEDIVPSRLDERLTAIREANADADGDRRVDDLAGAGDGDAPGAAAKRRLRRTIDTLHEFFPFQQDETRHCTSVSSDGNAVLHNYDDHKSTSAAFREDHVVESRFVSYRPTTGLSMIRRVGDDDDEGGGGQGALDILEQNQTQANNPNRRRVRRRGYERYEATTADRICLRGMILLPFYSIHAISLSTPARSALEKTSAAKAPPLLFKHLTATTRVPAFNVSEGLTIDFAAVKGALNHTPVELIMNTESITESVRALAPSLIETHALLRDSPEFRHGLAVQHLVRPFETFRFVKDDMVEKVSTLLKSRVIQNIVLFRDRLQRYAQGAIRPQSAYNQDEISPSQFRLTFSAFFEAHARDYAIHPEREQDNEILHKCIVNDGLATLLAFLAKQNVDLYKPNLKDAMYEDLRELEARGETDSPCGDVVTRVREKAKTLAKTYYSQAELESDTRHEAPIYYDKSLDPTDYQTIEVYRSKQSSMSYEEFHKFMSIKLVEGVGLTEADAAFEAESMIHAKRRVRDGDYALLEHGGEGPNKSRIAAYYVRTDNAWVLEPETAADDFRRGVPESCTPSEGCASTRPDACDSVEEVGRTVHEESLRSFIMSEAYDAQHTLEALTQRLDQRLRNQIARIRQLGHAKERSLADFDSREEGKGDVSLIRTGPTSPYVRLRDDILSQPDFIRKQKDVLLFSRLCTRASYEDESPHWLRCRKTDVELLPTFMFKLAEAAIINHNYNATLRLLCKEQGTKSDHGNAWTDRHSGYFMANLEDDTREGFNQDGFQNQTRDVVMDEQYGTRDANEAGARPVRFSMHDNEVMVQIRSGLSRATRNGMDPHDEDTIRKISNVATAIYSIMGIGDQRERIIVSMRSFEALRLDRRLYNRADWDRENVERARKNQKVIPWENEFHVRLMVVTLSHINLFVTTRVPPYTTGITFLNCRPAFDGYPVVPQNAAETPSQAPLDCLNYIGCIVENIKNKSYQPWSSMRRMKRDKMRERVIDYTENMLLKRQDKYGVEYRDKVIQKEREIERAAAGIGVGVKSGSPSALDDSGASVMYRSWPTFLPVLRPFAIDVPTFLADTFANEYVAYMRTGDVRLWSHIEVVRAKLRHLSMAIQHKMQDVVARETPLFVDANQDVYVENSCCHLEPKNTHEYFVTKDPQIEELTKNMNSIHEDYLGPLSGLVRPPIVSSRATRAASSRRVEYDFYASRTDSDAERIQTIVYRVFIRTCNLETEQDVPDAFRTSGICERKHGSLSPSQIASMSEIDKIQALRADGLTFDVQSLQALLRVACRRTRFESMRVSKTFNVLMHHRPPTADGVSDAGAAASVTEASIQKARHESRDIINQDVAALFKVMIDESINNSQTENIENARTRLINYVRELAESRLSEINADHNSQIISKKNRDTLRSLIQMPPMTSPSAAAGASKSTAYQYYKPADDDDYFGVDDRGRLMHDAVAYLKNGIGLMCATFPSMVAHGRVKRGDVAHLDVPAYWGLSSTHERHVEGFISEYYVHLKKATSESTHRRIMRRIEEDMESTNRFVQDAVALYMNSNVLNVNTCIPLLQYVWISIFHYLAVHLPQSLHDAEGEGTARVRTGVSDVISAYLDTLLYVRKLANFSYPEVRAYMAHLEQEDRLRIVGRFQNLEDEERRIEVMLKKLHLGVWGVNAKGIQVYDAARYDEQAPLSFEEDAWNAQMESDDVANGDDVDELGEDGADIVVESFDD